MEEQTIARQTMEAEKSENDRIISLLRLDYSNVEGLLARTRESLEAATLKVSRYNGFPIISDPIITNLWQHQSKSIEVVFRNQVSK